MGPEAQGLIGLPPQTSRILELFGLIKESDPLSRRLSLTLGFVDLKQEIIFGLIKDHRSLTGSLPQIFKRLAARVSSLSCFAQCFSRFLEVEFSFGQACVGVRDG